MATLHVRNIPDALYSRIQQLADQRKRSLSAEVAVLLEEAVALEDRRTTHMAALRSLARRRRAAPPGSPATAELLREDRAR
jgi:antitoxin FitA